MDLAKTLIRTVVRAFYETRHVLVIDALMVHSALHNDDLALLLGMQQKDLRKLCGKLREDRLLAVHSRQETREGMQRPITKDYYYIDFHATIDAIKYRVFHLTQRVKDLYKPSEERKDYFCPRCNAQWTSLEVLDNVGPAGFLCHRCDGVLEERDDRTAGEIGGHEKQSKLASQLEGLLKMLRDIDSEVIPDNDFETAFSHAVPVQRNEYINPIRPTAPVESGRNPPTAVKGITQVAVAPLEISLTTSSEKTAAEQAAEAQRKAEIAAQNALPVWHTNSTVTGETTNLGNKERERQANGGALGALKDEEDEKKEGNVLNDELAAYYAQMLQEKEKEAREDREADESSGDDEDDEFEDVGVMASGLATPSSSTSAAVNGTRPGPANGALKPHNSESGSSAFGTGISTPAGSGAVADEPGGPADVKRVKLEDNGAVLHETTATPEERADNISDEDEDVDFEDAL